MSHFFVFALYFSIKSVHNRPEKVSCLFVVQKTQPVKHQEHHQLVSRPSSQEQRAKQEVDYKQELVVSNERRKEIQLLFNGSDFLVCAQLQNRYEQKGDKFEHRVECKTP